MKLYRVLLRGMTLGTGASVSYGDSYVVAENPNDAYLIIKKFLDNGDLGLEHERELKSVELIAEQTLYPRCGTILFIYGTEQ